MGLEFRHVGGTVQANSPASLLELSARNHQLEKESCLSAG